ncbi:ribonuclease HII [Candidatus Geothermarchaeota archaeon ex4572_27]|nr:MAG: ribonuclease HII [Candidatus Geothermarchaeota archaeon ex4572_27]
MMIGGIDEAGRGPLLGPMVIAGYFVEDEHVLRRLSEVVTRDSKGYTPAARRRIYDWLLSLEGGTAITVTIHPSIIDAWVGLLGGLNQMEAYFYSLVIRRASPRVVYVDSCDPNPRRFEERIRMYAPGVEVRAEIGADARYPIVAAASIVAKVIRDEYIARLRREYGEVGSGYPSDPRTKAFFEEWVRRTGFKPPFARKTWRVGVP